MKTKYRIILIILLIVNIHSYGQQKSSVMSVKLGIGQGYLGKYFKKHVGEGIQQYITNYKLKLVETRLLHSNMRINEIVMELGFTDESHLNRLFKKYRGMSPTEFRKTAIAV